MDEAVLVREGEAAGDLDRELERALDRQRALAVDELLQVLARDVLEDDERLAVVVAAVDHGDDVLVREPGDELRLAAEALDDVLSATSRSCRTFSATSRSSTRSWARKTLDMPPEPTSSSSS